MSLLLEGKEVVCWIGHIQPQSTSSTYITTKVKKIAKVNKTFIIKARSKWTNE
jgi:hypothetical protein